MAGGGHRDRGLPVRRPDPGLALIGLFAAVISPSPSRRGGLGLAEPPRAAGGGAWSYSIYLTTRYGLSP